MQEQVMTDIVNVAESGRLTPDLKYYLRERIRDLEEIVKACPQIEVNPTHRFAKGVYAREIVIPKGSLIVGKIHRHANMNFISKGKVSFFSTDGAVHAEAPHTFVASPGVKRVIYAHEDTVWTTIHGTDETDLERIESEFIAKDYEELYKLTDGSLNSVLQVLGATPEELTEISEREEDMIGFPDKAEGVVVAPSPIHGNGLFATKTFLTGEVICPMRIGNKKTPAGRYSNHSSKPNAKSVMRDDGNVDLVAICDIIVDESKMEIFTDYYYNFTSTRR